MGSLVALPRRQKGLGGPGVDKSGDRTNVEKALDLMVVLVAAKVTGSPQSWPEGTSATHLRAAPLNFPVAYRTRAQEGVSGACVLVFRHTRGKKKFHQSSSIPWEVSPGRAGRPWVLGRVTDEQVPAN